MAPGPDVIQSLKLRTQPVARCLRGALLLLIMTTGCANRLPTYRWTDENAALRTLSERELSLQTVSSRCRIALERADGAAVQLDGALAARLPDALRLRAWKLSQPVWDLTILPEGIWLFTAEAPEQGGQSPGSAIPAARLAQAWSLFTSGFVDGMWAFLPADGSPSLQMRMAPEDTEGDVLCELHRPTLTVRRCQVFDPDGALRLSLLLDRYVAVNGIVFPRRITAVSIAGTITITLDRPAFNVELPPQALTPPRRAVKQP